MNIFRKEFAMMRSSCLWWCLSYVLLLTVFLSLYPAFSKDVVTAKAFISGFPKPVLAAFGLNIDVFLSFLGFYVYIFTYATLAGAVQAMNIGLSLLSKEASFNTTDFLLTKPVARRTILAQKLLAGVVVLAISSTVLTLAGLVLGWVFGAGGYSLQAFLLVNLAFFLVQLSFFCLGILVSQLTRRLRSVISLSLGLTFGFFALGLLGSLLGDTAFRFVTPFKFFDFVAIAQSGGYQAHSLVMTAATAAVCISISYLLYTRRDVRVVA